MPTLAIASHEQLLNEIRNRCDAVRSATLSIDVTASASTIHSKQLAGYSGLSAYILMRNPDDLRFILFVPIAHIRALDMASNREGFRLAIPAKHRYMTGPNSEDPNPAAGIEGIRPQIIWDALRVRTPKENETSSFIAINPGAKAGSKGVIERQQYLLSIHRMPTNSEKIKTERTILLDGITHLPIEQDIYGIDGALATRISYKGYRATDAGGFPTVITIWRPKEKVRIVLRIKKAILNQTLADDQFEMKFPEGVKIDALP